MIYGIDASSKTVAVTWWTGVSFMYRKYDLWDRWDTASLPWVRKVMARLLTQNNYGPDDYVFLEQPVVAGARNIMSTLKQSYVNGVIQEVIVSYGRPCIHVPISTWKKVAAGSGSASKEDVAAAIGGRYPNLIEAFGGDQDLYDATGLCIYGRYVVEGLEG